MLPNESDCRKLAERALSYAKAADASVSFTFAHSGNTRFANNEITTSGSSESVSVVVAVTHEGRTGRVSLNETAPDALERAVRRAEEIAGFVPPDPEYVGPLAKQQYLAIASWDEPTSKLDAASRLPGVRAVVEPAAKESLNSSGFFSAGGRVQCIANKAGNFGWHRASECSFSATARTADGAGSGWAEDSAWRAADLDAAALARRALAKARDSRGGKPVEPGDYTVILEPAAVAGLLGMGAFGAQALSARAAEEGRSYFSKKGGGSRIGEKVFHESVTIKSDPADPRRPAAPWGGGGFGGGGGGGGGFGALAGADFGMAARPIAWVEGGVLKNLWFDRYWAKKAGREPTPPPAALIVEGGKDTMESLIASTDRGLLVTNFWYIRSVNPQTLQLTGLTRDGLWLIEKGKIAGPVTNLRFNESPAVLLQNVLGMTPAERTGNSLVPAIKASNFTFTSQSDAV